jgi:flagellar protein FliS
MQSSAREKYLTNEVMTATPQKLQLMLIEAAIRSARRARERWQADDDEQACEALIRAQEAVGEMLAGLNRDVDADLVKKVGSVYLFVFRNLMEANHERDEKKLDDALRVLEVERETWRQLCEQLGNRKARDSQAAVLEPSEHHAAVPPAAAGGPPLPHLSPGSDAVDDSDSAGISLEA